MKKAGSANRVGGETGQAGVADAAIVGKRERKETIDGFGDYLMRRRKTALRRRGERQPQWRNRINQVANNSFREDAPPGSYNCISDAF